MVKLVDINANKPTRNKYSVKFLQENTELVTKLFLKARNEPTSDQIQYHQRNMLTNQRISKK